MTGPSPLPYRTDSVALASWLEARARGRSAEQLRQAAAAPKGVEGTAVAAAALGFVDASGGSLTAVGEQFALASESERRALVREALRAYPAYGALLQAIRSRAEVETEVRWIEAWWSTRGYGSSESNRREGAAAFGRLAEFAGLAEYIPGRRGRPTRLRWLRSSGAEVGQSSASEASPGVLRPADPDLFTGAAHGEPHDEASTASSHPSAPAVAASPSPPHLSETHSPADASSVGTRPGTGPARREPATAPAPSIPAPPPSTAAQLNRITLPLDSGAVARIEVPWRLPRAEKRRLLDLLHLLITED